MVSLDVGDHRWNEFRRDLLGAAPPVPGVLGLGDASLDDGEGGHGGFDRIGRVDLFRARVPHRHVRRQRFAARRSGAHTARTARLELIPFWANYSST
jgi:hypothetical protein